MPFVPSARRFLALFTGTALICLFALCTRGQASASVSSSAAGTAASGATVGSTYGGFSPDGDFLWLSDADLNRQFDLMKQSGASWVRLNIIWSVIEGSRGQFDWSTSDRVVAAARARGLQVLGLLTYTPSWASGSGDDKVAPRNPADIGPFAQAAVQRYTGQGVHAWEIWNEPNLSGTWAPHPDVAAYSALLKAAASAIRSADASATIIAGGLAPGGDAGDGSTISPLSFVRGLYAAGAGPYFSAVALHPYSFPALPMQSGTDDWNAFVRAPLVHQAMVDNGDGAKPIWFTEFGSPTGSAADAVSTNIQAQTIPQAYDQLANWPWAGPLFYYTLRDSGTNSADREQNFGLFRQDYSAKPAWSAFLSEMAKPSAGGPSAPPPPGAIAVHYGELGGPAGVLGRVLTGELTAPDGVGKFTHYANGSIYWTPATGAHEVHGSIRAEWEATGWETGPMGYPVTDETPTPDGVGRYNHFSKGASIYWTPATGAHEVHGAIRAKWAATGWETGPTGYPLTDETSTPDGVGRYNHFSKGGSIYWTPTTGAHEVHGSIRDAWAAGGWETGRVGYPVSDEYAIPGRRASDFQYGRISWDASTGGITVST